MSERMYRFYDTLREKLNFEPLSVGWMYLWMYRNHAASACASRLPAVLQCIVSSQMVCDPNRKIQDYMMIDFRGW